MRLVIQCAKNLSLTADGEDRGSFERGLLVLVGIKNTDTPDTCQKMAQKLSKLRIICDENDKMNLGITNTVIPHQLAIVSNFTLYANCNKSRRPDFQQSAPFSKAKELYDTFLGYLTLSLKDTVSSDGGRIPETVTGVFGADMNISFTATGPITVILDSDQADF